MKDVGDQIICAVSSTPKVFDGINLVYGAAIGFMAYLFGEHWSLFAGFLLLNVIDWISGTMKARKKNTSSSEEGAKGAVKKVWQWVVIAIAFYVSHTFGELGEVIGLPLSFTALFGWLVLAMYLVNEIRSILENLVEMGVDVPHFLITGLDITKKLMEAKADKELPEEEESTGKEE